MASRIYDRTLDCGCMYSADGGGGLMPCQYAYEGWEEDLEQTKRCDEAHKKWYKSDDYKKYNQECIERNK